MQYHNASLVIEYYLSKLVASYSHFPLTEPHIASLLYIIFIFLRFYDVQYWVADLPAVSCFSSVEHYIPVT